MPAWRRSFSSAWLRYSTSRSTRFSGIGTSTVSSRCSTSLSRAWAPCSRTLPRPSRVRTSARSSSRVSNSLAVEANSSSSSGSSLALTERTVTVTSASWPAFAPLSRAVVKVVEAGDLDVGLADDPHLVLADDLGVHLRHRVLHDLLEHDGAADALVEHAV